MPVRERRLVVVPVISLTLLLLLSALPVLGEVDDQASSEKAFKASFDEFVNQTFVSAEASGSGGSSSDTQTDAVVAIGAGSKLAVHGFLTQGYADGSFVHNSDGLGNSPSLHELSIGIPEDGTTDYRQLALQFRYQMSPKDIFIIQLSSRSLGFSPIEAIEDEVQLDWAFYERRLTDNTSVMVGRVQIPLGIYNEIRDVGTILPFYRPPYGLYRTGAFTSETVDGIAMSHHFLADRDWNFEVSPYYGEFDDIEIVPEGQLPPGSPTENISRDKNVYGVQTWLNTGISDLRFGMHYYKRTLVDSIFLPPGDESDFKNYMFSLDGNFSRLTVRSEYMKTTSKATFPLGPGLPFLDLDFDFFLWYVQVGVRLTDQFQIWGQLDRIDQKTDANLYTSTDELDAREDLGISLVYAFSPSIVLKAEYHEVEEESSLLNPVFTPNGLFFDPVPYTSDGGDYSILSLSVSF